MPSLKKLKDIAVSAIICLLIQPNVAFARNEYCDKILTQKIYDFYSKRRIDPYDSRQHVEQRLQSLANSISNSGLAYAPCYARQIINFSGMGYGSGIVEVYYERDYICLNEDDEYYDTTSQDVDIFPWSERWPGASREAPARAVVFQPICYDQNGKFTKYMRKNK